MTVRNHLNKLFAFICIALTLVVASWLFNFQPETSHLLLKLNSEVTAPQRIDALFYRNGSEPEGLAHRQASDLSSVLPYYLVLPTHFKTSGAILDLGNQPGSWAIHKAALRSRFLLFSLDTHRWSHEALAQALKTRQATTKITLEPDLVRIQANRERARLFLSLDPNTATPSLEFTLLRLGLILLIAGLLYLLWCGKLVGYLKSLVVTRLKDARALGDSHRFAKASKFYCCGGAILLCVLVYQLYPYWFAPGFYIEDTMEFADAASGRSSLWSLESYRYYRGYFVFVSELIVGLANFLPASWQAHLYMGASSTLLFAAIFLLCGSGIFTSRLLLLLAPTTILLIAFTDKVFYLSVTGTLFSSTLIVMALALRPVPPQLLQKFLWLVLLIALAWSGPYSAQLLPFAIILLLFLGSGQRLLIYLLLAVSAIAYVLTSASGLSQFSNLLIAEVPVAFFRALVQHIFFFNLFGLLDYKFGILIIIFSGLLLYIWRSDRLFQKISYAFLTVGLSAFITFYISSKYQQYDGQLLSYHVVISQFCWLVFLLMCADRLVKRTTRKSQRWFISAVLVFGTTLLIVNKERVLLRTTYFPPDPKLSEFLSAVETAENIGLKENEYIQLWYVKRRQLFTTSFHRGSNSLDAQQIADVGLPEHVKKFLAPVHLRREINSMVDYDTREGVLIYATFENPSFKRKLERPSHLTE